MAIEYLGNAKGVSAYKKTYHQLSLNSLMKIESLEFKLYFDVFFVVFFLAILAKYFPDARLSPQIRSGPVVRNQSCPQKIAYCF